MKTMDKKSLDYTLVRMYHDMAGDSGVAIKIQNEQNRNKRGKFLFYYALYFDILKKTDLAKKYYIEVVEMKSPMFFEYRMAEWAKNGD